MLDLFLRYIKKQRLIQEGQKILLAVSGGVDSVVLTSLFLKTDYNFSIAHCNFHLRGEESDGDEQFVRDMARKHDVELFTAHFDTSEYAKKNKISIQMAARDLRIQWFHDICVQKGFDLIATAHHLNDSIETVYFNLAKGTGIAGLHGILPKSGKMIRPLLFASREEILGYVEKEGLSWREDSSNSTVKYHRNLIRHKVIPLFKKINPGLERTLASSIERLTAVEKIYQKYIQDVMEKIVERKGESIFISIEDLKECIEPNAVLHEIISGYGFNYDQAGNILDVCDGQSGKLFYSSSSVLNVDRKFIIISQKTTDEMTVLHVSPDLKVIDFNNKEFHFEVVEKDEVDFGEGPDTAYLNLDLIQYPLELRLWQEGDFFQPLGMKGKKKLSDFMIDEKIPLNLKKDVSVILSQNDIVWVAGFRIDDRYKITPSTRTILRIRKTEHDDQPI